jgi:hypothetical protein
LKALAYGSRGANKDAYDLFYLLRHFGSGVEDVATRLSPLLGDEHAARALEVLHADFSEVDSSGPRRVAQFVHGAAHEELQADVRGLVLELLRLCEPG